MTLLLLLLLLTQLRALQMLSLSMSPLAIYRWQQGCCREFLEKPVLFRQKTQKTPDA